MKREIKHAFCAIFIFQTRSSASDKKATQPAQPVHRQNVEKVVSQETRQNDTKDRRTKVQQTQTVQKNQQTKEKNRSLVTKKGQKKK